jgi:hypothetical protein
MQVGIRSRPKGVRSSLRVSPIPMRPEGLPARKGKELGLMLTLKVRSHPPRRRIYTRKGGVIQRSPNSPAGYTWISSSLFSGLGWPSVTCPRAVT